MVLMNTIDELDIQKTIVLALCTNGVTLGVAKRTTGGQGHLEDDMALQVEETAPQTALLETHCDLQHGITIFSFSRRRDQRSPSPAGGILPLDQWPRKLRCWDICPQGFEGMSAAQVKNTGLFIPATYQPKVTNLTPFVDPARTTFLFQQSSGMGSSNSTGPTNDHAALALTLNPALAKQARRLWIGGIPLYTTSGRLAEFFNELMDSYAFGSGPGASVEDVIVAEGQGYAFVDVRGSS